MIVLFAMLTLGEAICRSKEIPIGTMPNTVQILVRGYDGQPLIICGGVIISENMFIVAAHCDSTEDYEGKFHHDIIRSTAIVKYGSERKNKGNIIKVMETIIHQRFDKEHRKPETLEEQMKFLRNSEYDVAIVIIEGEFLAYKGKIGVVDIDPYCFYDGMSAIFTGFGRYDAKENASQNAEQLRFAKAYPFHQGNFSSIGFSTAHITESDSGSGVFVARNETLFLIGIQQSTIVQDGVRLGVFLELKNFNPWIKSIMNKGKDDLKNGKEDLKNGKEDLKNGKEDLKNGKEDLKNGKEDLKNGKDEL
uniref:Peptidase S1 domain-containing protein n=1 Tax=Panagrolaimus davidi TaxID=227884 RepID=A0A914PPD2_9BILA